ncbi:COG3217 Uncharacterized Fe-S protein [Burkholderiaceae bacterium]
MTKTFAAQVEALWIYPIKSCAGVSVQAAQLTETGLAWDRNWMVVNTKGMMVTQRDLPRMALIQPVLPAASLDTLGHNSAWLLRAPGMADLGLTLFTQPVPEFEPVSVQVWQDTVPAFDQGQAAGDWLTTFLGSSMGPLRLVQFDTRHRRLSSKKWTHDVPAVNQFSDGFPILVASTASLDELNTRLAKQGQPTVDMRRFRPNVVLGDLLSVHPMQAVSAHDEDRVGTLTFATEAGDVHLQPVKPCPRCPIPNIDPDTAQSTHTVGDTLQAYRQDARVDGAVTFGMNAIPLRGVGRVLQVGQAVQADWQF